MENNSCVLEMSNITKSFSGVKALDSVSMKVNKGEIHALMGANGAGKSTLMKVLSGILKPDDESGKIVLEGEVISPLNNPTDAQNKGISIVFQELAVLRDLSVLENIFLNREITKNGFYDWKAMRKKARAIMNDLGIDYDLNKKLENMSIAEQQMVEITKAVSTDVKVLILDEPTSSLAEKETQILFNMIYKLRDRGVTIIYISHRMDEIFALCDAVTILRDGKFIYTKDLKEVTMNELARTMIGRSVKEEFPVRKGHSDPEEILRVENLTSRTRFRDINFSLHKGEILGLSGLVGAGRTEIGKALFGEFPIVSGQIYFEGKPVKIRSSQAALKLGIAYATEDRKLEGILPGRSLKENACLSNLDQFKNPAGLLNQHKEIKAVNKQIDDLSIKTTGVQQEIQYLSGGNQQKVCLAKWLLVAPKVLIFDEPTRGIDVGAKAEFYQIICDLADQGTAILMISSEENELIGLCDRILVLKEGDFIKEMVPYPGCLEELSQYMFGLEYNKEGTNNEN